MKNNNQKENWLEEFRNWYKKEALPAVAWAVPLEKIETKIKELLTAEREKWLKEGIMAIDKKLAKDMPTPEWLKITREAIEKAEEEERRKILSEFEKRIPTGYYPPTNSKPIIEN